MSVTLLVRNARIEVPGRDKVSGHPGCELSGRVGAYALFDRLFRRWPRPQWFDLGMVWHGDVVPANGQDAL